MLQQHSALFKARTETLNNRSAELHHYMVEAWHNGFYRSYRVYIYIYIYMGYIGIMEKKMETTGVIGVIGL